MLVLVWLLLFLGQASAQTVSLSATFAWDANTEADLAGYKVYYSFQPCSAPVPPAPGATVLKPATTYTVAVPDGSLAVSARVTAYDTAGNESAKSACVEKLFPPPPDPLEERVTAVEQKNVEQDAAILGLNDRLTVVESPPVPTGNITAKVLNADQVEITGLNCVKLTTSGSGLKRIVTCGH